MKATGKHHHGRLKFRGPRGGWKFVGLAVLLAVLVTPLRGQSTRTDLTGLLNPGNRARGFFNRVATFDVPGDVAEIVTATTDGRTLIYTDSAKKELGFVAITNAAAPESIGILPMAGEPTSVAVTPNSRHALAVVRDPNQLVVVDPATRAILATLELGGQPDSIAISPNGRYAAIAIENERNEDVDDGRMPQGPAGFLTIVDLVGQPSAWRKREVSLTGLAQRFPEDPEPEFVDINSRNIAAVTMQENNHIALVDLVTGRVMRHWSAGTTSHSADTTNDGNIAFTSRIVGARREPDAIAWTPGGRLLTANEGDYNLDLAAGQFIGGRDFTLFDAGGGVLFEPGVSLETEAARHGHYLDSRSSSKGVEIEGIEVANFASGPFAYIQSEVFAFVGSERGNFVAVYRLDDERRPTFLQLLPTGASPEGLLAIPRRGLFVTANEGDGTLSIFRYQPGTAAPAYPNVYSPSASWSALSGLAAASETELYGVPDSVFKPSRIFRLQAQDRRAVITDVIPLAGNYDLEGIALRPGGGWWLASEGAGNVGQATVTKNLLLSVDPNGFIRQQVELPEAVNAQQRQYGFEGVATSADGAQVYVAFQREWGDDAPGLVKIGRYTPATDEWRFFHYPIDAAPEGGWVGLSELTRIDDNTFAVLERDNQARTAATVKRIYRFSIAGLTPTPAGETPPVATKTLVRDLLTADDWRLEKVEGMALLPSGRVLVASDNDGGGETRLLQFRPSP